MAINAQFVLMPVPRLKRRRRQPEIRRKQILEAAKGCFRKFGFAQTRIADIADDAGISVGLVYSQFPSKEAVVEAIIADDLDAQVQGFAKALEEHPGDVHGALRAMMASLEPLLRETDRTALMAEILAETCRNAKLVNLVARKQKEVTDLFRGHIGATASHASRLKELEVRMEILGGLVTGVGLQLLARKAKPSPKLVSLLEDVVRYVLEPLRQ
jgi:AcrR family transcriptional regulator